MVSTEKKGNTEAEQPSFHKQIQSPRISKESQCSDSNVPTTTPIIFSTTHLDGQRRQEGEEVWRLGDGFPVQNGDAQGQERFGEVHVLLSVVGDGHPAQTYLGTLQGQERSFYQMLVPQVW